MRAPYPLPHGALQCCGLFLDCHARFIRRKCCTCVGKVTEFSVPNEWVDGNGQDVLMGQEKTNQRIGIISTARRWAEFLVAVLIGNIVYLSVEPQLPSVMRHRMYRIDLGLAIDFLMCVVAYGLVRLVRGLGSHSK
jgi:hypothetical protein